MKAQQVITTVIKEVLSIVNDKGRISKRKLMEELAKVPELSGLKKEI